MRRNWFAWVAAGMMAVAVGMGGDSLRGETSSTTEPHGTALEPTKADVQEYLSKEKKIERLVGSVTSEYERLLKSKDWMNRGLALVCMSRLPGKEATGMILKELQKDTVPIVRMIAWHCLAARSAALTDEEYKDFCTTTWEMVDKNLFPGEMRVGLMWWLQYQPEDARAKKLWLKTYDETNSQKWYVKMGTQESMLESYSYEGNDRPVITGLSSVLKHWRDPELMGRMIKGLGNLDEILRAELILRDVAGSGKPADTISYFRDGSDLMIKRAVEDWGKWWKDEQANWTEAKEKDSGDWHKLRSPYVPALVCLKQSDIDPDDPSWRKDLELGNPNIRSLNVALVVDATASMTAPIIRMRVDLRRLMTALSMIALEARVSVTFYRDYGDDYLARTVMPLIGPDKIEIGIREVEKMGAKGGGDEPEAVLAGLHECVAKSGWPTAADAKKIIILIGDAPPHDGKLYPGDKHGTEKDETVKYTKELAEKGYKIYAEKAVTGWEAVDLSAFDEIAEAGGGKATVVTFPGVQPRTGKDKPAWSTAAFQESNKLINKGELHDPYTEMMAGILTDLIAPHFRTRAEPMVKMLLAGLSVKTRAEKQQPWGKVEGGGGRVNPQGH